MIAPDATRLDPFRIEIPHGVSACRRALLNLAQPLLSTLLDLPTYRALYRQVAIAPHDSFCARALHVLGVHVAIAAGDVTDIPRSGPLIVVANHPQGMLDGLVMGDMVQKRRSDFRILTNGLLAPIPEVAEMCLFVDPFGDPGAATRSHAGLRRAVRWLTEGHALIVFPAGSVASTRASARATPIDSPWQDTAARLALRSGATVVPAFIEGHNSRWFYRAGRIHAGLRTLLLARELLGHRGRTVTVRIGRPLSPGNAAPRAGDATKTFREAVDRLASWSTASAPQAQSIEEQGPPSAVALGDEIRSISSSHRLIASGRYEVYCVPASSIPIALKEIGRLRALSFQAVGEGTGEPIDLDRFDDHYLHLFVWNKEGGEIVGAYRIGQTDRILASQGIRGLYTSTLFQYDARLLARLSPALELGRSFVRAEYQRSSNALLLLWKGIAQFVARSERYRVLFGPVTVSNRYGDMSQQLLRAFLLQNFYHRELGELVEAYTPPRGPAAPSGVDPTVTADVADLDRLIARLEGDGKGIPVLLRQYLRLNAKLLGFNVDPAFNDALDALMMVDLADVDPSILRRYFGKTEAARLTAQFSTARAA